MKKTAALLLVLIVISQFGGCGVLGGVLLENCVGHSSSEEVVHRLISGKCRYSTADGYLNGLGLDETFSSLDDPYAVGYKYSDRSDYEYFVFTQSGVRNIRITVIPYGKEGPEIEPIVGAITADGALNVGYEYTARRHEDYYEFRCRAVVECKGDKAYVEYDYSSVSRRCEIVELINALFYPKG
ncbi:MAG: hypothetical protein IJR61_03300 [Clostridia bacterium]|nr:hypothetical protein [Clostridia bacterium]